MESSIDRPPSSAYKHGRQASYHSLPRSEYSETWSITGPWDDPARHEEGPSPTVYPGGLATSYDDRAWNRSQEIEMAPLVTQNAQIPSKSPDLSIGMEHVDSTPVDTDVYRGNGFRDGNDASIPNLWTPFFLCRAVLIGFACLFAAMLIALEVLFLFSHRNSGLSTTNEGRHYLWTYGPTAVLIVIAGIWGQVEYRTKQLMPWKAMSQRPTPAAKSLLVDYISPWNVLSMFASIKASHNVVAITILGSLLIKLLTIVSTGLFMLQDVTLDSHHTTFIAQGKFDGSKFDSASVDGNAALIVAGVKLLNLTYPAGTTDQRAFQPFNSSGSAPGPDSVLFGDVDIFSADLECEEGELTNFTQGWTSSGGEFTRVWLAIKTPSCPVYHVAGFSKSSSSTGGYFGDIYRAKCSTNPPEMDADQVVIMVGHWFEKKMERFTALVCMPTYNITKGVVSLSGAGSVARVKPNAPVAISERSNDQLPNVSPWDIVLAVNSSLNSADIPISSAYRPFYNATSTDSIEFGTFLQVCNITTPQDMASNFLDAAFLQKVSRYTFSAITAQIARQYLMSLAMEPVSGSISASEHRLFVRELSLRIMEATLALLIIVASVVCIYRPAPFTSRDPGSIGGLATILARSSRLAVALKGTGSARLRAIRNLLAGKHYQTVVSIPKGISTFSVEPSSQSNLEESTVPFETLDPVRWWQPFSVTITARTLVLAIPLALIAALEATYQHSRHLNGLANIHSEGYIRYTWVYIPAMVMLIIRTLFDTIDFSAKIFLPYLELRRGGVTAQRSIMETHLSKVTLHSFWSALLKRQYALMATALAMLLAPSLTIIVSGLYSAEDVNYERATNVRRLDSFNSTINPDSARAGLVGSLIVNSNLPYPSWTHDELVFPRLGLPPTQSDSGSVSDGGVRVLRARVPALRSALQCELIPLGKTWVDYTNPGMSGFSFDVGGGCGDSGFSTGPLNNGSIAIENVLTGNYFGAFRNADGSVESELPVNRAGRNDRCAVLWGIYGRFNGKSVKDITTFTCQTSIEQVQVDTTFLLPNFKINETRVDESSAKTFANVSDFTAQLDLSSFLIVTNETNNVFDPFFSSLFYSEKTITLADITDRDNFPSLINASQHLYRVLMAQSLNAASRIPLLPNYTNTTLTGTIIDPTHVRLKQSAISTRLLEAFLAIMFICAAIAFSLMDTKEVLTKNPCSIAAGASLLAGAEMLGPEIIPPGSEWCNDEELTRKGVFSGLIFSLGWWDENGDGRRRFGIDVGRADGNP